jgi:hypothetical protein
VVVQARRGALPGQSPYHLLPLRSRSVYGVFGLTACVYWFFAAKLADRLSKGIREAPTKVVAIACTGAPRTHVCSQLAGACHATALSSCVLTTKGKAFPSMPSPEKCRQAWSCPSKPCVCQVHKSTSEFFCSDFVVWFCRPSLVLERGRPS